MRSQGAGSFCSKTEPRPEVFWKPEGSVPGNHWVINIDQSTLFVPHRYITVIWCHFTTAKNLIRTCFKCFTPTLMLLSLCVCVFPRYSAHGCTRHGQGDPGPVPGGASGQRHGGAPGWIIRDHHRHCQAHWRQRQPSTLHPEWVTQQLTQPPTWDDWLPGTDRQHNRKMTAFGHAALSVCTHMYSDCTPPPTTHTRTHDAGA